jgi:hypothetical protein
MYSLCSTLVDLVLLCSRVLLPMLRGLPLQRLAVDELFAGTPPKFTQPLFSHLTHLHLRDFNNGTLGGRAMHRCHSSPIWPSGELTSR